MLQGGCEEVPGRSQRLRIKILAQFYGELRIDAVLETRTHWMTDNLSSEINKKSIISMLITAFHA